MGLKFLGQTDLFSFINTVQGEVSFTPTNPDFALSLDGSNIGVPQHVYLDQLDKVVVIARSLPAVTPQRFGFNPLLVGTEFPDIFYQDALIFATQQVPMIPGDPLFPGGQKLYASSGGVFPGSDWEDVTPVLSLKNTGVGVFPTVPAGNGPIRVTLGIGTAIPPGPGTWNAGSTGSVEGFGFWNLVFEGLTDGIPGETNLVGPNVYPKGLMLFRARFATCPAPIGTGGANDCDKALTWLDLNTGLVDGRMALTPGAAAVSGVNTEAPIAGQTFDWQTAQYIPDVDATFTTPKGEMLLTSDKKDIPADPANFPQSSFVKMIDFNPFGVAPSGGAPNRVHERVRISSSVDWNGDPMFDVPGAGAAGGLAGDDMIRVMYHPPSLRFFLILAVAVPTLPQVVDEAFIGYWLRAADPAIVTSPVQRDVARTNDVVEYESFVTGVLSEPVAGVEIDWTMQRISSVNEALDGSFPGSTNVANPPIDQGLSLALEGTLVIEADGTPLVRGVDYNIILSNGLVSWITDQSGATTLVAKYEHRETPVSPPHGQLLSSLGISEDDGRVFTSVRYADDDDLVGQLDQLTSDIA